MGLDMYAFAVPSKGGLLDVDQSLEGLDTREMFYWRKFNHLHGWMARLYRDKGGTKPSFNCTTVRLTIKDLETLLQDGFEGKLTYTPGSFFGVSELHPDDVDSLYSFVKQGREEIISGNAVYYYSWW